VNGPTTLEFQNVSNLTTALFIVSNLILNGSCTVKITGTNNLALGNTYPLVKYTGIFSGVFTNFQLQMPANWSGILISNANQVELTITPLAVPAIPVNLFVRGGNAQITASWSTVSGANGYNLKRSTTNGGPYTVVAGNINGLVYTNSGLANGTMYYFVLSATNSAGESANSPPVNARPVSPAPVNFTFATEPGKLQLTWPFDHTGWRLQAQTNTLDEGLGTNWVDVSSNLVMSTNQVTVPMNNTNGSVFFHLIYP
jgi:hypothetical protein